tara:strand:- start:294 stop:980 length:687 start_codon:yes stop_codon:yes gene_type:complete
MITKIKKFLRKIYREIFRVYITKEFTNSSEYWERRYYYGGNSGRGSYFKSAKFKANYLNDIVLKNNLNCIIDIGCGDGNNFSLFKISNYIGIDPSETIITANRNKFLNDENKIFYLLKENQHSLTKEINANKDIKNSLIISFDVILHLVEDNVYKDHLNFINDINAEYCLVVSSDECIDYNYSIPHVKHRNFSKDLSNYGWSNISSTKIPDCPDKRVISFFIRNLSNT